MRIFEKTFVSIKKFFSNAEIESGGILGEKNGIVCSFYPDPGNNLECYVPNTKNLNSIIGKWAESDIKFVGIIHSHPNECRSLSSSDINYAFTICSVCNLKKVYFPVITYHNGDVIMTCYKICNQNIVEVEIIVI